MKKNLENVLNFQNFSKVLVFDEYIFAECPSRTEILAMPLQYRTGVEISSEVWNFVRGPPPNQNPGAATDPYMFRQSSIAQKAQTKCWMGLKQARTVHRGRGYVPPSPRWGGGGTGGSTAIGVPANAFTFIFISLIKIG